MQKWTCGRGKTSRKVSSQQPPKELGVFQECICFTQFLQTKVRCIWEQTRKNEQGRHMEREREGWEKALLVGQAKLVWLSSENYPLLGWKSAGKEKEGRERRGKKVGGFVTYASKVSQPCRTLHRSVHYFTRLFYRNCTLIWTERASKEQTQVNKTRPEK